MDRANPIEPMPIPVKGLSIQTAEPADDRPSFVVGQDPEGHWVAVETHGLGGGLFRTCADAIHYAAVETRRRPDAVRLATERVVFRM